MVLILETDRRLKMCSVPRSITHKVTELEFAVD